jgi:hypothetical protein
MLVVLALEQPDTMYQVPTHENHQMAEDIAQEGEISEERRWIIAVIKHLKVGSVPDDPKLAQSIRSLLKNLELQKATTERDNNIIVY